MKEKGPAESGRYMNMFFGESDPHSWEELKAIEARRRAILKRVELPFWRILGYWDGTCHKVLVTDVLMWISIGLYVAVRFMALSNEDGMPAVLASLDDTNFDIIGGFLSFFLVLFVNQANARFNGMYKNSMDVTEKIEAVAAVVGCYLPKANANRLVRYCNAAHAAGYVGLASETYSKRSFFDKLNEIHKFLTEKEMRRIREIDMESGPEAMAEILQWAIQEVKVVEKSKVIDARMSGELRSSIQKIRSSMGDIYHDKDQPIHFFYVHFLCLLTAFYLPLFAIVTAYGVGGGGGAAISWTSEIMSGFIVLLQAIFVIGLRLLGQVMVDPYGDDLEDLSVLHYIQHTWRSSNRILAAQFPDDLDEATEDDIIKTRAAIGSPWSANHSVPEMS